MNDISQNTDLPVEFVDTLELASQLNLDVHTLHQAMMEIWPLANMDIKMIILKAMQATGISVDVAGMPVAIHPDDYDSIIAGTFGNEKSTEAAIRANKLHELLLNETMNKAPS